MDVNFWHERWALRQIGFHQAEIQPLLRQFWPQVRGGDSGGVFVPLCGKTHDMTWLRQQGHPVVGVELSPLAVAECFAEAGLVPERQSSGALERSEAAGLTLYTGDFFALQPGDVAGCQLIYDRAALVALPPPMRQVYAAQLRRLFPHGARILLITFEYPQLETDGPPFAVAEAEVHALFGAAPVLARADALPGNPAMRRRGVSQLDEIAYLVTLPPLVAP